MKEKLTFITASAGSGKTYTLVEKVVEAVTNETARPSGIIATTFTTAAANEMKERISLAFHKQGLHAEAAQLENDALISTVHGICFRLLGRFAFEAGISPDIRVLDETEAKLLLDRSIDEVVNEETRQRIYSVASRLGQRDPRTWKWRWRFEVQNIIEGARSNDVSLDQLKTMGEASWREMNTYLGAPSDEDLDARLVGRIDAFLAASQDSTYKNTGNYRALVEGFKQRIKAPNFPWSNWEKLQKIGADKKHRERPEVKFASECEAIGEVAARVQHHHRLQDDLRIYIELLFDIAHQSGIRFAELKKNKGAADYADLEKTTLSLLRNNQSVREALAEEVDLILVDEFQDTSPIQLALFSELGKLAKQVIWVGDVKQSIYGFRGSDPELVFRAASGANTRETLDKSYRSLPDLVKLTNDWFGGAFKERLGIPESETVLEPMRKAEPDQPPAVELVEVSNPDLYQSGKPKYLGRLKPSVIADAVTDLLHREKVDAGDIAILTRKGAGANAIAQQLRVRGFQVAMSGPGLLETPEANLALACLRRWLDPRDTLAAAEIVALEGLNSVEDWLENRLEFIDELGDEGEFRNPWNYTSSLALSSLIAASEADERRDFHSPLASFDKALEAAGVKRIVSQWGPVEARAAQRLANIEQLRGLIEDFENRSMEFGTPATLNGVFGWLEDLASTKEDLFPKSRSKGAISVGTYHSSKGLEWPVVFLADLDLEMMSRLYNLRVTTTGSDLDLADPLEGRVLRQWIHPFGRGFYNWGNSHPLDQALETSDIGQQVYQTDENELLRLLYVGMTRARNRLVFFHEPIARANWLYESLGKEKTQEILQRKLKIPMNHRAYAYDSANETTVEKASPEIRLPKKVDSHTERLPAVLIPSSQDRIETATIGETIEFGSRLKWKGNLSERDLGDAMHRIFAAEVLQPGLNDRDRAARIDGILGAFDLAALFNSRKLVSLLDGYRKFVETRFSPDREEVEVPFTVTNDAGQSLTGFIDHLLYLNDGRKVIIDHKIFPGSRDKRPGEALGYSGQLATYAEAIAPGEEVGTWIHFASTGAALEVKV